MTIMVPIYLMLWCSVV